MKRIAVVLAVLAALSGAASLSGCPGSAAREAETLKLNAEAVRGIDIWKRVEEDYFRGKNPYQENVIADPGNRAKAALAITMQANPAPFKVGEPRPDETHPLTFEAATANLLADLDEARDVLEGDLTYDATDELAKAVAQVRFHAQEALRALEEKDRDLRASARLAAADASRAEDLSSVWVGANVASEEDEARALVKRWTKPARLIELNAARLWRVAATHRNAEIEGWSVALLKSCAELEEAFPRRRRRRRRRPGGGIEAKADEGPDGKALDGREGEPAGGPEAGPGKASAPGDEERPETESGPARGDDGKSKPDGGPPQVGAFLLAVAGPKRLSFRRRRTR